LPRRTCHWKKSLRIAPAIIEQLLQAFGAGGRLEGLADYLEATGAQLAGVERALRGG
jgi:hypothetical protein